MQRREESFKRSDNILELSLNELKVLLIQSYYQVFNNISLQQYCQEKVKDIPVNSATGCKTAPAGRIRFRAPGTSPTIAELIFSGRVQNAVRSLFDRYLIN